MKKHIFSIARLSWALSFVILSSLVVSGHPLGGVVQKTVISDLSNAILIEYNTHFEPEAVLTLHPDKDFNGVFDAAERKGFLERAHQLLYPNVSCMLGTRKLEFQEMDRLLSLEAAGDFKNGVNTKFVWRVSLMTEGQALAGLLRIVDNNFTAGEMNQLSYVVNVLGKNGPMALEGEGRELVLDLSAKYRSLPGSEEILPAGIIMVLGVAIGLNSLYQAGILVLNI